MPHETATLSTGYSLMNPERWLKYLHRSSSSCSLELDARLGSAEQLTTVAEAISSLGEQQWCPGGASPPQALPNTISLASNNLGVEALPLVCNLCAACPELQRLDLSNNRHLVSAPLELDAANSLTSLFFSCSKNSSCAQDCSSSTEPSVTGLAMLQDPNVLDAPEQEASAGMGSHTPATGGGDGFLITPSDLESLALNGNVVGTSMAGLVSSCLLHQQQSSAGPAKACGLRELHLEDAEMDAVAFATLLWGPSTASPRSYHQESCSGVLLPAIQNSWPALHMQHPYALSKRRRVLPHAHDIQVAHMHTA